MARFPFPAAGKKVSQQIGDPNPTPLGRQGDTGRDARPSAMANRRSAKQSLDVSKEEQPLRSTVQQTHNQWPLGGRPGVGVTERSRFAEVPSMLGSMDRRRRCREPQEVEWMCLERVLNR
jgi:hypothetical protein